MEILNVSVMLPAMVTYKHDRGGDTIMVYIDQKAGRVIIPDPNGFDEADISAKVLAYMNKHRRPNAVPPVPKDGFKDLNPDNYMNVE